MRNVLIALAVATVTLMLASTSEAVLLVTFHNDLASWSAATGGSYLLQDFEGYTAGDNLDGVELLPGVNVTSNLATIEAWAHLSDMMLFGYDDSTRHFGNAYYDINLSNPYKGIAFDVDLWDPAAPGPAVAQIFFADSSIISVNYYQMGPTEDTPVFFGVTSNIPITRIRWHEGPEMGGTGNEEVGLDNLVVSYIPEPSTLGLLGLAIVVGIRCFRRK